MALDAGRPAWAPPRPDRPRSRRRRLRARGPSTSGTASSALPPGVLGTPWYPVTKGSDRTCGGHARGEQATEEDHPRCPPPPLPASWLVAATSSCACGSAIRPASEPSRPTRTTSTWPTSRPARSSCRSATEPPIEVHAGDTYVDPDRAGPPIEVLEPAIVVEAISPSRPCRTDFRFVYLRTPVDTSSSWGSRSDVPESTLTAAAALDAIDEGVLVQDSATQVVYANRAAGELLGVDRDELRGRSELPTPSRMPVGDGRGASRALARRRRAAHRPPAASTRHGPPAPRRRHALGARVRPAIGRSVLTSLLDITALRNAEEDAATLASRLSGGHRANAPTATATATSPARASSRRASTRSSSCSPAATRARRSPSAWASRPPRSACTSATPRASSAPTRGPRRWPSPWPAAKSQRHKAGVSVVFNLARRCADYTAVASHGPAKTMTPGRRARSSRRRRSAWSRSPQRRALDAGPRAPGLPGS